MCVIYIYYMIYMCAMPGIVQKSGQGTSCN